LAEILVIDDDSVTCRTLARLLRAEGHTAHCVYNAQEAMRCLTGRLPQLLVLDVMLPDVTGLDLLRTLRADPRTSTLPVIFYTAVHDDKVKAEANRLGVPDFIIKGGGWSDLLPHIEKLLT
jgi:putative two-component system response regulator